MHCMGPTVLHGFGRHNLVVTCGDLGSCLLSVGWSLCCLECHHLRNLIKFNVQMHWTAQQRITLSKYGLRHGIYPAPALYLNTSLRHFKHWQHWQQQQQQQRQRTMTFLKIISECSMLDVQCQPEVDLLCTSAHSQQIVSMSVHGLFELIVFCSVLWVLWAQ